MADRTVNTHALIARRKQLYPSRVAFCEAADVSYAYVKFIENGTCQPSRRIARALARALKWDVEQLYSPDETPSGETDDEDAAA